MGASKTAENASNPRRMRVSAKGGHGAKRAMPKGTRIRLRLSPLDMAVLNEIAQPGEAPGATIRRIFDATAPLIAVLGRLEEIATAVSDVKARLAYIEVHGLVAKVEEEAFEVPASDEPPDAVTKAKQSLASRYSAADEDE